MNTQHQSPEVLQQELEAGKKLIHELQAKLEQMERNGGVRPRAERQELQSPVEFIGDFDIVHAEGINVSDDGVSFEVKKPLAIEMHYLQDGIQMRRRAHLVWMKQTQNRGYQFGLKFVEPDTSMQELDRMLKDAEEICQLLEIPYRIVQLCTAELGFASMKSFDIEIWAPGCGEWLEVSSCSNCGDFQARRANIRYRPRADEKPRFVHTLNGSGVALPRVVISILENYQQADGSVKVPEALKPYMKMDMIKAL